MEQEHPSLNIMKELSDIKTNLAVNTTETKNIKENFGTTLDTIRKDLHEMKDIYITRREYTDAHDELVDRVSFFQKILWGTISTLILIGLAFLRYIKF